MRLQRAMNCLIADATPASRAPMAKRVLNAAPARTKQGQELRHATTVCHIPTRLRRALPRLPARAMPGGRALADRARLAFRARTKQGQELLHAITVRRIPIRPRKALPQLPARARRATRSLLTAAPAHAVELENTKLCLELAPAALAQRANIQLIWALRVPGLVWRAQRAQIRLQVAQPRTTVGAKLVITRSMRQVHARNAPKEHSKDSLGMRHVPTVRLAHIQRQSAAL